MKNQSQRRRQANILSSERYHSDSTIGPRQASIIYDIFMYTQATKTGVTRDTLSIRHPAHALHGNSFLRLKRLGLVKGNGRGWNLTANGEVIARRMDRSAAAVGVGFVARLP